MRTRLRRSRPRSWLQRLPSLLRHILHRIAGPAIVRAPIALPAHSTRDPAKLPTSIEEAAAHRAADTASLTIRSLYRLVRRYPGASLDELLEHYGRLLREADYPESQIELHRDALRILLSTPLRKRPRVEKR